MSTERETRHRSNGVFYVFLASIQCFNNKSFGDEDKNKLIRDLIGWVDSLFPEWVKEGTNCAGMPV
jgi:hypothetical protein